MKSFRVLHIYKIKFMITKYYIKHQGRKMIRYALPQTSHSPRMIQYASLVVILFLLLPTGSFVIVIF